MPPNATGKMYALLNKSFLPSLKAVSHGLRYFHPGSSLGAASPVESPSSHSPEAKSSDPKSLVTRFIRFKQSGRIYPIIKKLSRGQKSRLVRRSRTLHNTRQKHGLKDDPQPPAKASERDIGPKITKAYTADPSSPPNRRMRKPIRKHLTRSAEPKPFLSIRKMYQAGFGRVGVRTYQKVFTEVHKQLVSPAPAQEVPINLYNDDLKIYVGNGKSYTFNMFWLRDACPGKCCIDTSTTQKRFNTADIPENLGVRSIKVTSTGGVRITWKNDFPQYGAENEHFSFYSKEFLEKHSSSDERRRRRTYLGSHAVPWTREELQMLRITYDDFMFEDRILCRTLMCLIVDGLVMITRVPSYVGSVELIAKRIGNLRDSLYGRTWDVKSKPQAENVAYTSSFLGLHMDLLYMKDPPGLQLLHCMKNTCEGGTAIFSDAFKAAKSLSAEDITSLATYKTAYHYRNNNEHYYQEHKTLELGVPGVIETLENVNWSPPFQAPYNASQQIEFPKLLKASRNFAKLTEAPENMYRHDYQEGECVIFNNRRILHGREEFEAEGGERWLRGAYVDTDVFHNRLRVLDYRFYPDDG